MTLFSPPAFFSGVKMYRTTRSPMMQPLVNSGMGMAPFFKVTHLLFMHKRCDYNVFIFALS